MTISTTAASISGIGDGVSTSLGFNFEVPFQDGGTVPALVFQVTSALGVVTTPAFSVSGAGNPLGGSITLSAPVPVGSTWTIARTKAITQPSAFVNQNFFPNQVEESEDILVLEMQQIARDVGGAVRGALGEVLPSLPSAAFRAGKYLSFDPTFGLPTVAPAPSFATASAGYFSSLAAAQGASVVGAPFLVLNGYSTSGDGGGGLYIPASAGAGAGKFQTADGGWWILTGTVFNPLQFGATQASADCTTQYQNGVSFATARGAMFDGLNLTFNVSQIRAVSNLWLYRPNLMATANATSMDYSLILVDGVTAPVSNVRIIEAVLNGNRVAQTSIVGDGKRHGIAVNGRVANVKIVRPQVSYCATDGIRCDAGGVVSANDTDYLQQDVQIIDADLQWNGRWGWSGMSQQNMRWTGLTTNNGKNLPGYPAAPYTSGGNARNATGVLSGPLYGGGFDLEDEGVLGGGFNGVEVDIVNLGNSGAVVVSSDKNPTTFSGFVTSKNLTLRVTGDVGNTGAGLGTVGVVNNVYTGNAAKTFENVNVIANVRNDPMYFIGVDKLIVTAVHSTGTGAAGAYSVIDLGCSRQEISVVSDSTAIPQIYISSLPFTATATQFFGTTWTTVATPTLSYVGFIPGAGMRVVWTATITPAGAGASSANLAFTTGSFLSDVSASFADQTTGQFLLGGAHTPGTSGTNGATFGFTALGIDPILVSVSATVKAP